MSEWRGDRAVEGATARLADAIVEAGYVTEGQLAEALRGHRQAFVFVRAVDRAFATIDPYHGVRHHGRLGPFCDHLDRWGRYNSEPRNGAVLPRRTFPSRPQRVPDHESEHLLSLMLVPPLPSHLHMRRLAAAYDFPETFRAKSELVVGCVAFIGGVDELEVERIDLRDSWYSIRARSGSQYSELWKSRIEATLKALDKSGAHLGVLPELALTDEILELWKDVLLSMPRPSGSDLEWVLVGSGPITVNANWAQQPNRAVMLHRDTAERIHVQDKCEPFTIDDRQLRDWGLTPHLGQGPLAEWMRDERDRYVLETRVGRLAVLICEDHGRLLTVGAELAAVAPTHLFIPIFAPPILRYRWQEQAAEQFANSTGSVSVVVTSYALASEQPAQAPAGQYGTALVLKPTQEGAGDSWSAATELRDAQGDPERVLTFSLPRC
jgi:predicted amidohydrolase